MIFFSQTFNKPQTESLLIKEIDQWEQDSINKIQQRAKKCRQFVTEHTNKHIRQIGVKLTQLDDQIKEIRQVNNFNEMNLNKLNEQLKQLQQQFHQPSNISIQEDSTSLINKLSVVISFGKLINLLL